MADTTGDHPATRSPGGDADASLTGPRPLSELKPKTREPGSVSILTQWINHAERTLGVPAAGGRMGWLVASTVAIAALQRAVDATGTPAFLLKCGTLLQHRLGMSARSPSRGGH